MIVALYLSERCVFKSFQSMFSTFQVHSLSLVLNKKLNELARASVSNLSAHLEMLGVYHPQLMFVIISSYCCKNLS